MLFDAEQKKNNPGTIICKVEHDGSLEQASEHTKRRRVYCCCVMADKDACDGEVFISYASAFRSRKGATNVLLSHNHTGLFPFHKIYLPVSMQSFPFTMRKRSLGGRLSGSW